MKIRLTSILTGEAVIHDVELTTNHPASRYKQVVMLSNTDGEIIDHETWVMSDGRIVSELTANEENRFDEWHRFIDVIKLWKNTAPKAGKILADRKKK